MTILRYFSIENDHLTRCRADRKSQVRQYLGFCTAYFLSLLAYESPEQKPKHCPTLDLRLETDLHNTIQSWASYLSQGFEHNVLARSSG